MLDFLVLGDGKLQMVEVKFRSHRVDFDITVHIAQNFDVGNEEG